MSEKRTGYDAGEHFKRITVHAKSGDGIDIDVYPGTGLVSVSTRDFDGIAEFTPEQTAQLINALQSAQDALQGRSESEDVQTAEPEPTLEDRAVRWLEARGKVCGTDFTRDSAIVWANVLAFESECARRVAEEAPIDFLGNCEDCPGWDGVSRRCECGNRRVQWVASEDHTFESPSVMPDVY